MRDLLRDVGCSIAGKWGKVANKSPDGRRQAKCRLQIPVGAMDFGRCDEQGCMPLQDRSLLLLEPIGDKPRSTRSALQHGGVYKYKAMSILYP